jgi:CheY-like chemotaxis protein
MQSILIIEDDQILREMYKDKLERNAYVVHTAVDGDEGLKFALQNHPDLILLDLVMPKVDGTQVMDILREDSWGKDIPIIVLTNLNVDGEVLKKIIQDHPTFCMMKVGVTPEDVLTKVQEALTPKS